MPKQLRVEAELEDVGRLGGTRELGVERLIAPVRLPFEEVGDTAPVVLDQHSLVNDVDAVTDRLPGFGGRRGEVTVELDLPDELPCFSQTGEVGLLML